MYEVYFGEGFAVREVTRVDGCVTNVRKKREEESVHWRTKHLEIESQSHAHVHAIYKSGNPM